jgi:hypothetical protein
LSLGRVASALHNPWYAGAYAFGRGRWRKQQDGKTRHERLPAGEWHVLIKDAHPGYISWQEYERIEQRLQASAKALGFDRRQGPPREGPALLQGRAVCGLCGSRMLVQYSVRRGTQNVPNYVCVGRGRIFGDPQCQSIVGAEIDAAIGKLVVEAVTPMAIEVTLAVQQEILDRVEEADRLRHRQVERAQYDADHARHRYMQVDPKNRLVADSLEADWNARLRALAEAQQEYERLRAADRLCVDEQERKRILALATDFPAAWRDPNTPQRERKRMFGLLVEDVTLIKQRHVTAAVRFRGGATTTLTLPRPLTAQQQRATHVDVRREIDALLDDYTDAQVANIMNERRLRTGVGDPFDRAAVQWVRFSAKLKSLRQRLLDAGMLTGKQMAAALGISRSTVGERRRQGRLVGRICNGKGEWLYWHPNGPIQSVLPAPATEPNAPTVTSTVGGAV